MPTSCFKLKHEGDLRSPAVRGLDDIEALAKPLSRTSLRPATMKAPAANWGFHVLDEGGRLPSASCVSAVSLSASVAAAWQSALRRPVCADIHIVPHDGQ